MHRYLPAILLAAACGTTQSDSLLTSGMSAEISAVSNGSGTTAVTAELFNGDPDQLIFVDLDANDQLVATAGSQSDPMTQQQLGNIIDYTAQFSIADGGTQITVDLQRDIDAGAPSSTATLPAPFTLGALASSASRAADLVVTWGPSGAGDPMSWQVEGSCVATASGTMTDTGSVTIAAGALVLASGTNVPTSCSVTLSVFRVRSGTLDSHFGHGGSISAEQVRTAQLTSTP